jgi:hypothetical protein
VSFVVRLRKEEIGNSVGVCSSPSPPIYKIPSSKDPDLATRPTIGGHSQTERGVTAENDHLLTYMRNIQLCARR